MRYLIAAGSITFLAAMLVGHLFDAATAPWRDTSAEKSPVRLTPSVTATVTHVRPKPHGGMPNAQNLGATGKDPCAFCPEGSDCFCASWYGPRFHGRRTASGTIFNMNEVSAAHRSLAFGTKLLLRNPETGQELVVPITDRGPDGEKHPDRHLDLSRRAAALLGMIDEGVRPLEYRILSPQ